MVSKHPKSSEKASVREVTRFHISTPKPWVAGSNPPAPATGSAGSQFRVSSLLFFCFSHDGEISYETRTMLSV